MTDSKPPAGDTKLTDAPMVTLPDSLKHIDEQLRDTTKTFDELELLEKERAKILKAMEGEHRFEPSRPNYPSSKKDWTVQDVRHQIEWLESKMAARLTTDEERIRYGKQRNQLVEQLAAMMRAAPPNLRRPSAEQLNAQLNIVLDDLRDPNRSFDEINSLTEQKNTLMKEVGIAARREQKERENQKPDLPQLSRASQLQLERAMSAEREAQIEFELAKTMLQVAANAAKFKELEFKGICKKLGIDYNQSFSLTDEGHVKYDAPQTTE